MLLVVTGIGLLIHIYSIGYMAHEGGYYRFFAYLNLFMFFMLMLVLAANYLVLFVGWEGVGLCSYLLIGFYFLKKSAGDAGKKAFIVNRIGDFGFSLAMFLIFVTFGSLDFGTVFAKAATMPVEAGAGIFTAICLLLFVGATGKSAQIPLYVWLPDAMEGPTPVSALIHAATMVTAGVYMVARSRVLFEHAPIAMNVVAIIGLLTAVLAATIGLVQNDIKKVFAYSTVSQLGYMFLALRRRRVLGRHLPPHDARVLQGAALPRRRQRHPRAVAASRTCADGRPAAKDPDHLLDAALCAAVAIAGVVRHLGLLQQGRDPDGRVRQAPVDVLGRRDHRRHDGVLRLPRDLPGLLRRVPRRSAHLGHVHESPVTDVGRRWRSRAALSGRRLPSGPGTASSRCFRTAPRSTTIQTLVCDREPRRADRHRPRLVHLCLPTRLCRQLARPLPGDLRSAATTSTAWTKSTTPPSSNPLWHGSRRCCGEGWTPG